ncbi:septum formation family protein [Embleya sp. NPDC008237]|uniref:septum formation family protein n=1 Tax=Embleya sp. NPDC008237 TaxID=3363978 RepID=UPI0036E0E25A
MRVSRFSGMSSTARAGRRRAVARSSAAALAVLLASTLLVGCLGKDDKKKDDKGSSSGSKPPMITMPPAPTLPAKADPSAAKTTGGGGPTPSGTASKSTGRVKMVELHKGECINEKGEDIVTVGCTSPHDAEVVGEFTLPSNMSPTSMTFKDDIGRKCTELVTGAAQRNSELPLSKLTLHPTAGSWINENDRALTCLLKRLDGVPLTAPLK